MIPEIELLLCCSRIQITPQQRTKIRQFVRSNLNWDLLISSAHYHNIAPLLYWHLKGIDWEGVPEKARSQLTLAFQANLKHNFLVTSTLIKVFQDLHKHDLQTIPFKGSILATTIYGSLALRRIRDIDLLVKQEDFFRIKQFLIERGYYPYDRLNRTQEKLRLQTNYEDALVNEETGIKIDIHWGFNPPYFACNLPIEDVFQRVTTAKINEFEFPNLAPEDLLLVLCLNGAKDGWFELQRVCDIAEFLKTYPNLDWQELYKRSHIYKTTRILLLGLILTQKFFGIDIPPSTIEAAKRDRVVQVLSRQIYHRLVNNKEREFTLLQRAYFPLQLQQGIKNKIYYCWHLLLRINERDLEFILLPRSLFFLYYPLRLIRLIVKYSYALIQQKD